MKTARHPLINRSNVRRLILDLAVTRAHRFTRVAETVFDQIEAAMREQCRRIVHAQPSAGRTIK